MFDFLHEESHVTGMNSSSFPAHFVSPGPMFLVSGHLATKANQSRSRSMLDRVEFFSS